MAYSINFKNIRFKKLAITIVLLSAFLLAVNFCYAATPSLDDAFGKPLNQAAGGSGYNIEVSANIESLIGFILNIILSFLGVIFLVLAIYGGYIWMIARGNEQEVEKAKNTLTAAVIGIIIVVAAYAISYYVISALGGAALKAPTSADEAAK